MLKIISLVALCFGFSLMSYDSFKDGSKLLGCLGLFVVIINLMTLVAIMGGK